MIIASYSKPEDAYLAASALEAAGISVLVRDADTVGTYWLYSNAIGGVKLEIAPEDAERARGILELPRKEESLLLKCPHCGSGNTRLREMNVFAALSVALGVLLPFRSRKVDCLDCGASFGFREKVEGKVERTGE